MINNISIDPLNPSISPHERYVTKYMCEHFPDYIWDYYSIIDRSITIYYHIYEYEVLNSHISERFDGQITISLNELYKNYERG